MRKRNLTAGAMIFALLGLDLSLAVAQETFAGEEPVIIEDEQYVVGAQEQQKKPGGSHCQPQNPPGPNGECRNPPPPVCPQPDCPDGKCSPPIKPGECWSQCIIPAKFRTVTKPVQTCQPCPTPVVRQSGSKTVSKEVELRKPSYGYKIPAADCGKQRKAGEQYVKVAEAQYGTLRIKKCVPHPEKVLLPTYRTQQHQLSFPYAKPSGVTGSMTPTEITVQAQSPWEHLYRKATPCPPNGSGMTDCSAVCSETKGPLTRKIRGLACADKGCRFTEQTMPPVVVPYNVEIGIPPQLPPPETSCTVEEVTIMTKPPVYKKVAVMESACESGKPVQFPVPGRNGMVTAQVPLYDKTCQPGAPVYDCVSQKVQACRPVLVWRQEAICQDDGKGHSSLIGKVQNVLIQAGYDAGPADGILHDKTKQAIWKFQEAKGLAVGGSMTKETLEALGIYQ